MMRLGAVVALAAASVMLAGCGGGDSDSADAPLLAKYHSPQTWVDGTTVNPGSGLSDTAVIATAKDACQRLAGITNPLPGEKEKAASYFVEQGIESSSGQPFADSLEEARGVILAAESARCPQK